MGVTEGLVIDLDDLVAKAHQADVLMLSHMRGHIVDMDALIALAQTHNLLVIEDCAHTMGAKWGNTWSGRSGIIGCYSCQTYKHVNSGEGGLLICNDDEIMARAILLSGSYMTYGKHWAGPPPAAFDAIRLVTPNISDRMDNLRATILRPQLRQLESQCRAWNARYHVVYGILANVVGLTHVQRVPQEKFVASSYQFLLLDWPDTAIPDVVERCLIRGVELKWFGASDPVGFTSRYDSWTYAPSTPMPASDRVLQGIMDMRLPLTFSLEDCSMVARIISEEVALVFDTNELG